MRILSLFLFSAVALTASPYYGQGSWQAFRSDNYDPYSQDGRFDIRAYVDDEVEFVVRGGRVAYTALRGQPPRDAGSEYRKEVPRGEVYGLRLEQRDGRGRMWIVEEPSRRNNYSLVVRVSDPKGGDDRYHARITWEGDRAMGRDRPAFGGPVYGIPQRPPLRNDRARTGAFDVCSSALRHELSMQSRGGRVQLDIDDVNARPLSRSVQQIEGRGHARTERSGWRPIRFECQVDAYTGRLAGPIRYSLR